MTQKQIKEIEETLYFESIQKDLDLEKAQEVYEETIKEEE